MKKIYLLIATLCCVAFNSVADSQTDYSAKTGKANFGGKKFYVNPGHGGHDSNDRPTPMPLGVATFYESDANLERGKHLKDFLVASNANVRMSRTTNYTSDDLGLTTIASRSNSYGGYFISLHSNGGNASANYVVSFYCTNGSKNNPTLAKTMGKDVSNWQGAVNLTNTTYSTPRTLDDYSFMGWCYGVLKTNTRPGYLVESWFHDYRPESLRMKSSVYNKFLAWQVARASYQSLSASGTLGSVIIGDVRDLAKSCGYTNYATRGRDSYLAINEATVNLYNSDGTTQLQTMKTDNCCNGVYAFFVDAGTYYVEVKKDGYKTQKVKVTVGTNAQVKQVFSMTAGTDSGISASTSSIAFSSTTVGSSASKTFTVTGESLSSTISVSSNNSQFKVSPASLSATGGTVTVTYSPTAAGSHTGSITLTSGSYKTVVVAEGSAKNAPLSFTEKWNYSETSGKNATDGWSADKAKMRNMCYGDGKLYVVDAVSGVIRVINAKTGAWIKDLNMEGVSGGLLKIIDVKYIDGKILGTNIGGQNTSTGLDPLKVYIWDNDNAAPRKVLETSNLGTNVTRIGDTFTLKGNLKSGSIYYVPQYTATKSDNSNVTASCIVSYSIKDGVVSTTPKVVAVTNDGEDGFINLGLSPRVELDESGKYWIMGQSYYPILVEESGLLSASLNPDALGNDNAGNTMVDFKFKGTQYAFATRYTTKSASADRLYDGRAALIDATNGWSSAENIGEYPSAGLSNKTRNTTFSGAVSVAVNGDQGVDMWILTHNQGIAHFSHGTSTVALTPKLYASDSNVAFEHMMGNVYGTKAVEVIGVNLTGDVSLVVSGDDADMFSVSTTTISKESGYSKLSVKYKPTEIGSHTATLSISTSGAETVSVTLSGECNPNYTLDDKNIKLTEGWNFSTNGTQPSYIDLTNNVVRATAYQNGKLYILQNKAFATPVVTIVDAYTGAQKGTLNMTGVGSATVQLSDILAVDGKIIGCACVSAAQTLRIYQWDSDSSAPKVLLEQVTGKIMGGSMSISGNLTNGRLWFTNDGTSEVYYYTISNGVLNTTLNTISLMKADGTTAWSAGDGRGSAEVILNSDGTLWIDAKDEYPALFNVSGNKATISKTMNAAAFANNKYGTALKFFTFGERKLAASVTYKSSNTNGQLVLIDTSAGVGNETLIETNPTAGLGSTANAQRVSSVCVSTDRNDGMTLDLWVCVNGQGVAYYTYNGKVEAETNVSEGDVNTDGVTDVSDVMTLANYILSMNENEINIKVADVNKDGTIDVSDIMSLANKILGK